METSSIFGAAALKKSTITGSFSSVASSKAKNGGDNNNNNDGKVEVVTTTKALLLSLTVPRIHRVYIPPPPKKQPSAKMAATLQKDGDDTKSKPQPPPKSTKTESDKNNNNTSTKPLLKRNETLPDETTKTDKTSDTDDDVSDSKAIQEEKDADKPEKAEDVAAAEDEEDDVIVVKANKSEDEEDAKKLKVTVTTTTKTTTTTTTTVASTIDKPSGGKGGDDDNDKEKVTAEDELEESERIGYVQEDSQDFTKDVVVEHVVTAEEMAAIVKLEPLDEEVPKEMDEKDDDKESKDSKADNDKDSAKDDDATDKKDDSDDKKPTHVKNTSSIDATLSNLTKMIFAVMRPPGGDEGADDVLLDREQAIAALRRGSQKELGVYDASKDFKEDDDEDGDEDEEKDTVSPLLQAPNQPNTEIKVEALVRMCFRNLFLEGHFFNLPIYTRIDSRQVDADDNSNIIVSNNTAAPLLSTPFLQEWIQVDVMVKDPSIGLILERLERIGVGSSVGTVSIFKAELCRTAVEQVPVMPAITASVTGSTNTLNTTNTGTTTGTSPNQTTPNGSRHGGASIVGDAAAAVEQQQQEDPQKKLEAARAEWKNAASRLRVEQVKEQIHEAAKLSFDFLSLLTIASILAGIGLIVNSTVVIVASMLVSPIMGPVMGMTFGSRVLDWDLAKSSFVVESIALLLAVLIGAIIGISTSWSPVSEEWPTTEMLSRGDVVGLLTGVAIAIPSGMGVALSILGNQTAALVGVAISASLLPPAVNAGICWAHALLIKAGAVDSEEEDFAAIGGISFALTAVNIVCIWVSGMLMFSIKEVAPAKMKSTSAFWSRDIKIARAIKRGNKTVDMDVIKEGIQNELKTRRKAGKPVPTLPSKRVDALPKRTSSRSSTRNRSKQDVLEVEEDDNVRYVGLEDMAHFLGFDEEDEDFEEEEEANGSIREEGLWGMIGWPR